MSSYRNSLGIIDLPAPAQVTQPHLDGCTLVPYREDILARLPKALRIAEVGVQRDDFSQTLLDICQPLQLWLFDLHLRKDGVERRYASEVEQGLVTLREGDSSHMLRQCEDGYFDVIYIDGDHAYEGVKKDVEAARLKVKPGGWLIFNDYTFWS